MPRKQPDMSRFTLPADATEQERRQWNELSDDAHDQKSSLSIYAFADKPKIPPENQGIAQASIEKQVYIFNAGPLNWTRGGGSAGEYLIGPSPRLGHLSVPIVIPGFPSECVFNFDDQMVRQYHTPVPGTAYADEPGYHFAMEVIGCGVTGDKQLRDFGVFVSRNERPSELEIWAARGRLRATTDVIIGAENEYWERWRKGFVPPAEVITALNKFYPDAKRFSLSMDSEEYHIRDTRADKLAGFFGLKFPWMEGY